MNFFDGRYGSGVRFAHVVAAKRERARRAVYLPSELFAEPAWDIMLELYSFELVSRQVSESELGERTNVPSSTWLRWMKLLEATALIARRPHPDQAGVVIVSLSPKGLEAMNGYFSKVELPRI